MSELWSYSLSDLQLFSLRVYSRLFELHNQALWPAHILTVALGLAMLYMLARPTRFRVRLILATLGALWLWVAGSFFFERYATINWLAVYVAPFAALQAYLLFGACAMARRPELRRPRGISGFAALGIPAFAIIGYPLITLATGRSWSGAEVFGIAPDPTAVATVAVLAQARRGALWPLMLIPGLWCLISGLTLWILEATEFFVAPVCAMAAVLLALAGRR